MSTPRLLKVARNRRGRDVAVGDIHGHYSRLRDALRAWGFDAEGGDRLFCTGDLVDRGPESHEVLDWLAKPWFFSVRGNHDDMAMRWVNGHMPATNYYANGGGWNIDQPVAAQQQVSDAMARLPIAIEVETAEGCVGIVHADCPLRSWASFRTGLKGDSRTGRVRSLVSLSMWSRRRIASEDETPVADVLAVVVGHNQVPEVRVLGNTHHIDTGGWLADGSGHFTLLDLHTLQG